MTTWRITLLSMRGSAIMALISLVGSCAYPLESAARKCGGAWIRPCGAPVTGGGGLKMGATGDAAAAAGGTPSAPNAAPDPAIVASFAACTFAPVGLAAAVLVAVTPAATGAAPVALGLNPGAMPGSGMALTLWAAGPCVTSG